MNVLRKGMSLVLVTLMTLSPLTAFAQGDAAAETSSGAGQAPQTTITAPDVTQPTTVEEPTATVEDTAPISPDAETLPQLAPEEAAPASTDDADLETQLVSQDGLFRYKQYGEEGDWRVIVTEYLGEDPDIVVPATLDGKKVVEAHVLVYHAEQSTIKSISLSEGITKFEAYLNWYPNLETLKLPSTLENTYLSLDNKKLTTLNAPTISELNLSVSNSSPDLSYLKKLTNLSQLTLTVDGELTTTNANILKDLSNLTSLSVSIYHADSIDSLTTLKNLPAFTSLCLAYLDNSTDLTPLKSLTGLTNLELYAIENVSDFSAIGALTNLKSLTLNKSPQLSSLSIIASCTQLTQLKLEENNKITTLDGLDKMAALTELSCSGCTNLSNIDAIKELQNLTKINLINTSVAKEEAITLIQVPQDITLYPNQSKTIDFFPKINIETSYSLLIPDLVAETPSVVTIDGRKLSGNENGTNKIQLQCNGKNIGKSFNVTYLDEVPEPSQPVGAPIDELPTLTTQSGTMIGDSLYGQFSDNSLWFLSNGTPQKVMDNAKYLGDYVYKRGGNLSWQLITDTQDTLWSYDTTYGTDGQTSTSLTKRVENAVDAIGLSNWDNGKMTAYVLDQSGQVWQLNETGNLLTPKTQKLDTDVKQLTASTRGINFNWIGYLKNNGDLYVKYNSEYYTKTSPTKIASGVKEIIDSNYYRGSDDKVYSINGKFVNTDQSSDEDEWQIISTKRDYITYFWGNQNYYIMPDNTTAIRKNVLIDNKWQDQYTTVFDFPITAAKSGRSVDALSSQAIPAGRTNTDLVSDKDGGLWEINTTTNDTTKITDNLKGFVAGGYILNDGSYYNVDHTLIDTHVVQVIQTDSTCSISQRYKLKDDGIVYLNDIPLLDHVAALSTVGSAYSMLFTGKLTQPYFTRTDGTLWTMPESGELKPYKIYDNLGNPLLIGDTNDDGLINASDALQDLRHSVKEIELTGDDFTRGNVNKDEFINASDALQILRYSVKEITEF